MIFADKLIRLRKQSGWSQEELAEQMEVTRQSVSKWEGAQSIPDLEKMLRLSNLFGVSMDYLLKDEIEEPDSPGVREDTTSLRRVSMEEANRFLTTKHAISKPFALATFLCILSPICLFLLSAVSVIPSSGLSENAAAGIGMIVLLVLVAAAVAIFLSSGSKTAPFDYIEKEAFETEYGVCGMVKERKEQYKGTYTKYNTIGVSLCILSLLPLFGGLLFSDEDPLILTGSLSATLVLVGVGVMLLVYNGVIWSSYEALLQEGEYSKGRKAKHSVLTAISVTYWLTATAIFLAYSFTTDNWNRSWIIWVVAGVLYPALSKIVNIFL